MQNGKGSKPRPVKLEVFRQNFDEIDWGNTRRNKVQKMFGVEVKEGEFTCLVCDGTGKDDPLDVAFADRPKCQGCNGKGKVEKSVFMKQMGF